MKLISKILSLFTPYKNKPTLNGHWHRHHRYWIGAYSKTNTVGSEENKTNEELVRDYIIQYVLDDSFSNSTAIMNALMQVIECEFPEYLSIIQACILLK
jgi:hypothetical protein